MKKLLCIICLLAAALFVNSAEASIGSPVRNGRSTYSLNTVRVSATCTTCGRVAVRPVVRPVVRTVTRVVTVRPILRPTVCTRCGRVAARRPVIRRASRPVLRTTSCSTCGFRPHVSARRYIITSPARYHVLSRPSKRLACTRCGR